MNTYKLEITISTNGYSAVIASDNTPCMIYDKFKAQAKELAAKIKD